MRASQSCPGVAENLAQEQPDLGLGLDPSRWS